MTVRRWLIVLATVIVFSAALAAPMLTREPATARVRPFDPIRITSVTHLSTTSGVALAAERVCNSTDQVVTVFVSLSWQDHLTTTVYANIVGYRDPGCHKVYLRALEGDGHLVVTETPVRPDGVLGVPVTRAAG